MVERVLLLQVFLDGFAARNELNFNFNGQFAKGHRISRSCLEIVVRL